MASDAAHGQFWLDRTGLVGKRALIVGGGGGLGRAIADDFAAAGVDLVLLDHNAELLASAAAHARSLGVEVVDVVGDARDPDTLDAVFATCDEVFGAQLDICVNVVGGTFHQPFAESNRKGWDAIMRTNFTWLIQSCHNAIPRMRAAGGGSIINLTSIEGHRAAPNFAVYAGMKGAVLNFTRTLAVELAPEQIRVNTIAADMVPTEGSANIAPTANGPAAVWAEGDPSEMTARIAIPMGRRGRYTDVGSTALFLASDLSCYMTGMSMHPDGGALASSGWFNWPDEGFRNVPTRAVVQHYVDAQQPEG